MNCKQSAMGFYGEFRRGKFASPQAQDSQHAYVKQLTETPLWGHMGREMGRGTT